MEISQSYFKTRCKRAQDEMAMRGIDVLIIDQPEIIHHFSGYAMSEGFYQLFLLPREGEPSQILRAVDAQTCRENSWVTDIVGYCDWESPFEVLRNIVNIKGWNLKCIGIDENSYSLTVERYHKLKSMFTQANFVNFSDYVTADRSCKNPAEIELLRQASDIADKTILYLADILKPGVSTRECAALSAAKIIRLGGDASIVGPITNAIDDARMHAPLGDETICENSLLHVEQIPMVRGYAARIMRPFYMGLPPAELEELVAEIIYLQDKQFDAMVPGAMSNEVDSVLRSEILARGLKESYINITGYSLGYYQLHTARSSDFTYVFCPNSAWHLSEGMVFHMYTQARGMAFSETIVITNEGAERLTQCPRKLFCITT